MYYLTVLEVRKLKWAKSKMLTKLYSSGGSGEKSVSLPFRLLEAICIPWLVSAPAPSTQTAEHPSLSLLFSLMASPSLSLTLLPPSYETLVITMAHPDNPEESPPFQNP